MFKDRRAWARDVVITAGELVERAKNLDVEIGTVKRSCAIAVENVKQHVGSLSPKYEEARTWAKNVHHDQKYILDNWDTYLDKLQYLPAIKELGSCLYGVRESRDRDSNPADAGLTLKDFEDPTANKRSTRIASDAARRFAERVDDLENLFEDVAHDADEIVTNFDQEMTVSDSDLGDQAGNLMEEVEVVTKKISTDYEHVSRLPNTDKSTKELSKTASLHTRNFLPALHQTHDDIHQLLLRTVERKNSIMAAAVQYMQKVSIIESTIAQVHSQLAELDVDDNDGQAFEVLDLVMKLPTTYGSLLIECVRRREWAEKITADSSVLLEEVATIKDEEAKRRSRWAKSMGDTVDMSSASDMAIGIDINLQSRRENWPNVSRENVEEFLGALRAAGGLEDTLKTMDDLKKGLDTPTKQQIKRAKAFKNGSMHDASPGSQSLLLRRNDDVVRSLESDKSKLEDRVKSYESRVRKLEDLLHRQTQTSRPPSGHTVAPGLGQGSERQTSSPVSNLTMPLSKVQDIPSRASSVSSRKVASESEEKALNQRVMALESELAVMQQQAASNVKAEDDLRSQVQEAVSTKEDLLSNMEAQQREFDTERRLIEGENGKLKIRLEEFEDEMDKMLESREHDPRVQQLEKELEKVRNDCAVEIEKAEGQMEFLKNDYTMQREKANTLERQVRDLDEEVADLSTRLQKRDLSAATNHRSLRTVMARLSKDSVAPADLDSLVETVEELSKQSQEHLAEIEVALATVRAENATLDAKVGSHTDEIHELKDKISASDMEVFSLREDNAKHKRDHASLQSELETERSEHSQLRSRFATGETDAASLRTLIEEKEAAIAHLNGRIAGAEADCQRLEQAVTDKETHSASLQKDLDERVADLQAQVAALTKSEKANDALASDIADRTKRAEEVSARLYTLKNAMGRVLEQVGYSVTKQDDTLTIQRVPKAATSSIVLTDGSSSMMRSVSTPAPSKSLFDTATSTSLTNWPSSSRTSQPEDFANFMSDISSLPLEAFSEAIIKRVKDADHTSRKYVKEARAYREKYRRIQSETHDKITIRAFKEGDLVLFLPTRNQATGAWAAFNIGYPHYFLREQESHRLPGRDWLLARISKIESRVVDLSKSINGLRQPNSAIAGGGDTASDGGVSIDDENPFELSDGLRWYLMDATEEKLGAPMTIGSSKSTVAAANVDAQGSMGNNQKKATADGEGEATVKLRGSLDSRRSSTNSKASINIPSAANARPSTATSLEERLLAVTKGNVEQPPESLKPPPHISSIPSADATQPKRHSSLRHSSSQEPGPDSAVRNDLLFGP